MSSNTYVAIATQTLATAASSVTFSSIPSGYTDLILVATTLNSVSTNQPYIQINSDTSGSSTNYSTTSMRGDGSSANSGRHTNNFGWYPVPGPGVGTNGNPEPWIVHIMNYANATTYKTALSRFNNAISILSANAHLWRSTAAITSITITMESGNFNAGSTFNLYGIASAEVGAKATGGTIYQDASYFYHVFTSNGTFTPTQSISADVLVVAGGGGGGGNNYSSDRWAGGGGAGGLRTSTLSLSSSVAYTCTVGAGGSGSSGDASPTQGVNSSISGSGLTTFTSAGGGAATFHTSSFPYVSVGTSGGSGGGGSNGSGGVLAGNTPSTSPSQGNNGGEEYSGGGDLSVMGGGGGGGAGAAGSNAPTSGGGGQGGIGATSTLINAIGTSTGIGVYSAGNYYLAGGGSGSSNNSVGLDGGLGGGGKASGSTAGSNGLANTGGGGGGKKTANGYSGGSGVIIVRYAK